MAIGIINLTKDALKELKRWVKTDRITRYKADIRVKAEEINRNAKVYQVAYTTPREDLFTIGPKMDFFQTCVAMGAVGATDAFMHNLIVSEKDYIEDLRSAADYSGIIGIYADSQAAAKVLALAFGNTEGPRAHGYGCYYHYHASGLNGERIHIWFGTKTS